MPLVIAEEPQPIRQDSKAVDRSDTFTLGVHACGANPVDSDREPVGEGTVVPPGQTSLRFGGREQRSGVKWINGHVLVPQRRLNSSSTSRVLAADVAAYAWPAIRL